MVKWHEERDENKRAKTESAGDREGEKEREIEREEKEKERSVKDIAILMCYLYTFEI